MRVGFASVEAWRPWLSQAQALLDDEEQGRVQRLRRAEDRESRTLAYALHRLALSAELGMPAAQVPLYRDGSGCPRLQGEVAHTSLSHCDGAIAWAVGRDGAVGIDLEPAARGALMPELAARICHPDEARDLARLAGPARNAALLALWVRKEAVLKAAGIGMAVEMTCFRSDTDWVASCADLPGPTRVRTLQAGKDWVAALATAADSAATVAWVRP